MHYKIELIDADEAVVGFFEVDPATTMAALVAKLEEAAKAEEAQSAVGWQIRRPSGHTYSGSILCQIKNLPQGA